MNRSETERYIETREERVAAADARTAVFERLWSDISRRLIELAEIGPGDVVLDIGTGHGEPAVTAGHVVGPTGRVVGTDFHPEILDTGRRRAAAEGLAWVEFEAHDGRELDFDEATFDAAVSRLAFMFIPETAKAMASVSRVLKPGARFSIAVCGPEESQRTWCFMRDTVAETLGVVPPPPTPLGEPGTWALADPGLLERVFADAGFTDVAIEVDDGYTWEFESAEAMVQWHRYFLDASPLFDDQPEDRRELAREACRTRARGFADADGTIRMPNQVIYATGATPGA